MSLSPLYPMTEASAGYIVTKIIHGDQQRSKIWWSALPHETVMLTYFET